MNLLTINILVYQINIVSLHQQRNKLKQHNIMTTLKQRLSKLTIEELVTLANSSINYESMLSPCETKEELENCIDAAFYCGDIDVIELIIIESGK